ncbi:protoheme IX farnesyltransferase [Coniophora puteana RWD-64-598 SS2]|uniref:Protoheme IX farnesyltransferase, mitochondrial n=1 Tax=Coniophora puteana (strain RWD-64-598) TaxID=741705 RepID=A0A5M3MYF1_CONPW|nr:protoheme IX farnesyltransferase [Coniophora puteana RWD-64-598 SS2]EIW84139.1 protoheme IX farnesyltransferase [Coniophora puteana RWD-64-598 SS2]
MVLSILLPCSRACPRSALRPLSHLPLPRLYSTATLPKREFTSYFFHNATWNERPGSVTTTRPTASRTRRIASTADGSLAGGYQHVQVLTPRRLLGIYAQLSKARLTTLIVLTAMSGVALSPLPATLPVLLSTAVGTTLCSSAANALNQLQEVPYDAQMARTRMRPLVRRAISPMHALGFATITGVAGPALLWVMVNPTTAVLGALNIALYAGAYTWLKRKHVVNTWVGSVVGGIPPLMGWTACGGNLLPSSGQSITYFLPPFLSDVPVDMSLVDSPLAPLALFMILYSWQFPHFNSLSHLVRASYAQAGYKMLSVLSPSKNALVSFRYAALHIPICTLLFPLSGLTTWAFALTSLVPNAILVQAAWRFWRTGAEKEARALWHHSLWYLPVILALMMVHKQGANWGGWFDSKEEKVDGALKDSKV